MVKFINLILAALVNSSASEILCFYVEGNYLFDNFDEIS